MILDLNDTQTQGGQQGVAPLGCSHLSQNARGPLHKEAESLAERSSDHLQAGRRRPTKKKKAVHKNVSQCSPENHLMDAVPGLQ